MILFFYGEDTYRSWRKIKELKEKYISASLGDTNLVVLNGKTVEYPEISRQVLAFPFLAKSRLVIIENLLKEGKKEVLEKVIDILNKVPASTVLVFTESGKPDKRISLFKKLSKEKTQEFLLLDEIEVKSWIKKETEKRGAEITPEAIARLFKYVGNDLWRLSQEIDKLTIYSRQVTGDNIELLVRPQIEANVFNLIDSVGAKNRDKSLRELHRLLDSGQNELYILSMIVYQFRNLLVVRDLVEQGVVSQWEIAKRAGLHPFVAGKTLAQAKNYTIDHLKTIYQLLLDFDFKIKTGQIEPKTALDLLVLKLCLGES